MADATLTQGGLPEKEWFTLQEVAKRWTRMTGGAVSVDDVLHYEATRGIRGGLNIQVQHKINAWRNQLDRGFRAWL